MEEEEGGEGEDTTSLARAAPWAAGGLQRRACLVRPPCCRPRAGLPSARLPGRPVPAPGGRGDGLSNALS